jgi:membrane protein YqaA with SNARE-associated domain
MASSKFASGQAGRERIAARRGLLSTARAARAIGYSSPGSATIIRRLQRHSLRSARSQVSETSPVVAARPAPAPSRGIFGLLRRMYDWTLSWAETKWGPAALGVLAFTESSFFPIPPDPLLMALSLGKPRRAFFFAALCTACSVLGGVLGYFIGHYLWEAVNQFFFQYVPGFTEKNFKFVEAKYQQNAFLAIFAAAFTPIPYKVFTVASGVFQTGVAVLVSASVLGRGLRFFLVAGLLRWIGEPAKHFIDRYFNLLTIAFFVLLALGFAVVKYFL